MVWVSVVDCHTLGLLLGKDFMKALKLCVDYDLDTFDCKVFNIEHQTLPTMKRAGHYRLDLLTGKWTVDASATYKSTGLNNVVQCKTS